MQHSRWATVKKLPEGIDAVTEDGTVKSLEFTLNGQRVRELASATPDRATVTVDEVDIPF